MRRAVVAVALACGASAWAVKVLGELSVERPDGAKVLIFEPIARGATADLEARAINRGQRPLIISAVSIFGDDAGVFSAVGLDAGLSLASDGFQPFTVRFSPKQAGDFSARLVVDSNDATGRNTDLAICGQATADGGSAAVLFDCTPPFPPDATTQGCSTTTGAMLGLALLWLRRRALSS